MTDAFAVIAGKLSARAIRAVGAGLGSNLPGRVSLAISKSVLSNLAKQSRYGVLAVSGTNGKSTTSGFISSILDKAGFRIAHNKQGANLVPGITASLVEAARWDGRLDTDYCLFETDEAALPVVARDVVISSVVVTNLFRDQLDRFGELDTTASLINKGIAANKSRAVLNADDPNVAQLAPDCQRVYYGIRSLSLGNAAATSAGVADAAACASTSAPAAGTQELSYCPKCGGEFTYMQLFYGQLGHYVCASCAYSRPEPSIFADEVSVDATGSSFVLNHLDKSIPVRLALPGLFNVYNALAASALATTIGIELEVIRNGLQGYTTLFGRSERLQINGKSVLIQLIKNPAGASQAIRAAVNDPSGRILIAINDNYADGRDVSWLWDAEFELLSEHKRDLFVSGVRAYDMAVRLKYCGISTDKIRVVPSLEQALQTALADTQPGDTLWILPTYTCLLELQRIAKNMGCALSGT
jgi:lipid II isoglutaminyl synthase (glutamine-hydrolysing)